MKSGTPLKKSESCTVCNLQNSMVSQAELISKGYHSLARGFISFFIDGNGPFNTTHKHKSESVPHTSKVQDDYLELHDT